MDLKILKHIPDSCINDWDDNAMELDQFIRQAGFKSCFYVKQGLYAQQHWTMSQQDYTWFIMKWHT